MISKFLFKVITPIVCVLSVVLTPVGVAAAQCNNACAQSCCEDQCCDGGWGSGWWKDAAIFLGAAAIGAGAGVAAGYASGSRGHVGDPGFTGATGATGGTGFTGATGAGFTTAVVTVPPGVTTPPPGTVVTSLTFTFTTVVTLLLLPGTVLPYVTTPDGRTYTGSAFSGIVGLLDTATVFVPGPIYSGNYDVGVVVNGTLVSLAGLVEAEVTSINNISVLPVGIYDRAGIVIAANATPLTGAGPVFYNAQYPFPQTP